MGNKKRLFFTGLMAFGLGMGLSGTSAMAAQAPELSSFPKVTKLWITAVEGSLRPAGWVRINSGASGEVEFLLPHNSEVAKGTLWAIQSPERLENERRGLILEREGLEAKLNDARWEAAERNETLEMSLAELENQRSDLVATLKEADSVAMTKNLQEALDFTDGKIARLKGRLDPARLDQQVAQSQEQLRLALARREMEFEQLERNSRLTAAFSGKLRYLLPQVQQPDPAAKPGEPLRAWVEANQTMATLSDDSSFEVVIPGQDPIFQGSPLEQLSVHLEQGAETGVVRALYARQEDVDAGERAQNVMIFKVIPEDVELARKVPGENQIIYVYRSFPEPVHVVRKEALINLAPQILADGGWPGLIAHLWPGAKVLQVGLQTIAIASPAGPGQ